MIKIVKFHKSHLDLLDQREIDKERFGVFTSESCNPFFEHGDNFTVLKDGCILMVGGVLQASEHTAKVWTLFTRYAEGRSTELVKRLLKYLDDMMQEKKLHRLETSNLADAEDHIEWCRFLGFESEGIMRKYDDYGRDYVRMAKTTEV